MSHLDTAIKRSGTFTSVGEKSFKAHRVYDRLAMLVAITTVKFGGTIARLNRNQMHADVLESGGVTNGFVAADRACVEKVRARYCLHGRYDLR